ncbi:MAG: exodeoxyribonuclease IX [Rhodanobacteraceae bacterium]|nr:exodeoxyribonuclease IX [Xanthomonadales bacterium]MCP5477889.1 exodeoxyribonuclease IX [Rhodanobacteraceae bacterium]
MKRSETLFLVDASMYVFRAWHSMPDDFIDVDGHPVNAVHGFTRFLLELLERQRPQHIAVAFDEALESSFRNERYPAYKANRDPAPDSLKRQFQECQAISRSLGLATVVDPRYEADDLIGTLLVRQREAGFKGLILSADKDLSQLLREGDQQWDYARNQRWDHDGVRERYGVRPEQIPDFLGLTGDSSDNIPGVPGIGPKTASALLEHFHDLDSLLARAHEVEFLRLRGAKAHAARLREHAEQARLSRDLATISLDAPIPEHIGDARRQPVDQQAMDRLCERLRFGALSRRRINELPEPD